LAAALAGAAACAPPIRLGVAPTQARLAGPLSTSTVDGAPTGEPTTVVVRYFSFSPTVAVVAWDTEQASYGLRAIVRRDGSLVEDHQLFVNTYYFVDFRALSRAYWHAFTGEMELSHALRFTGLSRDVHHCEGDSGCSPYEILTARIPDGFLKASRDSVVVRIYGRNGRKESITLRREMIDAYLEKVAFVSAALQKN
jgi:hypothetical protein